jgi:hypothetical protein
MIYISGDLNVIRRYHPPKWRYIILIFVYIQPVLKNFANSILINEPAFWKENSYYFSGPTAGPDTLFLRATSL